MESYPLLPQFYSELNRLVDDYQKDPKEAKLDHIYDLIKDHFQTVDFFSETQELKQLSVKLKNAHVKENHKVMKFVQGALKFPTKRQKTAKEMEAIDWEKMLPQDIWKEILLYLGKDFSKIPFLSKSFQTLLQDTRLQASIVEKHTSELNVQQLIALSKSCGHLVKKLDLKHLKDLTDEQLTSLIKAYPNLQVLNLSFCKQISDEGLASLAQLQNLQTLNLSMCNKITDQGLAYLAQLKNLQILNLAACTQITDQGLVSLTQLQKLKTLGLSGCYRIKDQGLKSLEQLQNLQTLTLTGCIQITDRGLAFLAQLKNLQALNLSNISRITENGLQLLKVKNIIRK